MTNEQQCHLKEKLISELLEEVESIKTSFKNMFLPPSKITINVPLFKKLRDIIFFGGRITL